jgi:hypothetical protein
MQFRECVIHPVKKDLGDRLIEFFAVTLIILGGIAIGTVVVCFTALIIKLAFFTELPK